jgi:4-aminobutyrate aminotransferase/(S)-3-amino-2-methylpropionate transaminase
MRQPADTAPSRTARSKALFDEEQRFIAPGLQTIALLSELAIESGHGATLTDCDGRTYLDLNAGVSVASLGHCHPRYVTALGRQLATLTVGSFTTRPRAELVRLMASLAPGGLTRTQFFSGGAEAVEAAIRLARSFTKRSDIVGFTGAFHGKTGGVLALSDVSWKNEIGPLAPGLHLAEYPDPTRFAGAAADCLEASTNSLCRVIEEEAAGRPAAIIVEPVQGTAGNIVPPDGFLSRVREVAHEYGACLIADEMITGFGRTGAMFGCFHDSCVPDILTVGKGMASGFPMSAVISTDEIVAAEPFSLPSASSSSYGGNPLAAAAALTTIRTIIDEGLVDHAARVGRQLRRELEALAQRQPLIANVRGRGLLIGFDLVTDPETGTPWPRDRCARFFKQCLAEGLILMGYSPRVRIHPPLVLTDQEATRSVAMIEAALEQLHRC